MFVKLAVSGGPLQQRWLCQCGCQAESVSSSSVLRCWTSTTLPTTSCQSPIRASSCWSCPDTRASRCWKRSWNTPSTSASPSTPTTTPASPSLGSPLPTTAAKTPTTRTPTPSPPTPPKTTWRDTDVGGKMTKLSWSTHTWGALRRHVCRGKMCNEL